MGRKNKNVVDYFPHSCTGNSKTMYILEKRFGNDGYAVWFKTLELLAVSENHFYDCRNTDDWEFLSAKMHVSTDLLQEIYDLLAKRDAINQAIWDKKVIWSENFVANLDDLYKRRKNNCMQFNDICKHIGIINEINVDINNENVDISTQSKVKESKEDESKGIATQKSSHQFPDKKDIPEHTLSDDEIQTAIRLNKSQTNQLTTIQDINRWFEDFKTLNFTGTKFYENRTAIISHFNNWVRNQKKQFSNGNNKSTESIEEAFRNAKRY
jgi:Asp-tRNA(Asn)/Glu-tRNA(Gln) amidotransferase C subunit